MFSMQGRGRMEWRGRPRRARRVLALRRLGTGPTRVLGRPLRCKSAGLTDLSVEPSSPSSDERHDSPELLEGFCCEPQHEEQLALNAQGRLLLLRPADIDWLEAEDDAVTLHIGRQTVLVSDTLRCVMAKLPPGMFARIAPSTWVNVRQIKRLRRLCRADCQVVVRNGTRVTLHLVLGQAAGLVAKYRRAAPDQIPSA